VVSFPAFLISIYTQVAGWKTPIARMKATKRSKLARGGERE
jgi:hypothetical protein